MKPLLMLALAVGCGTSNTPPGFGSTEGEPESSRSSCDATVFQVEVGSYSYLSGPMHVASSWGLPEIAPSGYRFTATGEVDVLGDGVLWGNRRYDDQAQLVRMGGDLDVEDEGHHLFYTWEDGHQVELHYGAADDPFHLVSMEYEGDQIQRVTGYESSEPSIWEYRWEAGQLVEETYTTGDSTIVQYTLSHQDGEVELLRERDSTYHRYTFTYDEEGRAVSMEGLSDGGELTLSQTFEYDDDGRYIGMVADYVGRFEATHAVTWGDHGGITSSETTERGAIMERVDWTYDEVGNVIGERLQDKEGEVTETDYTLVCP